MICIRGVVERGGEHSLPLSSVPGDSYNPRHYIFDQYSTLLKNNNLIITLKYTTSSSQYILKQEVLYYYLHSYIYVYISYIYLYIYIYIIYLYFSLSLAPFIYLSMFYVSISGSIDLIRQLMRLRLCPGLGTLARVFMSRLSDQLNPISMDRPSYKILILKYDP